MGSYDTPIGIWNLYKEDHLVLKRIGYGENFKNKRHDSFIPAWAQKTCEEMRITAGGVTEFIRTYLSSD